MACYGGDEDAIPPERRNNGELQREPSNAVFFPILSLPDEILLAFIDNTPYHTLLALRLVSQGLCDLIPAERLTAAQNRLAQHLFHLERTRSPLPLYLVELTSPYRDQFFHPVASSNTLPITIPSSSLLLHLPKHRQTTPGPPLPRIVALSTHSHGLHPPLVLPSQITCYVCLLPLPPIQFAARHITDRRRPGGPHCRRRFCIDCAIHSGRWRPGTTMRSGSASATATATAAADDDDNIKRIIVCEACGDIGRVLSSPAESESPYAQQHQHEKNKKNVRGLFTFRHRSKAEESSAPKCVHVRCWQESPSRAENLQALTAVARRGRLQHSSGGDDEECSSRKKRVCRV